MSNEEITVTVEELTPPTNQVQVVINNQMSYIAIDGESATIHQLLNAVLARAGHNALVVETDDDGNIILPEQVFVVGTDGAARGRTRNGNTEVLPGERVVQDRKHHNG